MFDRYKNNETGRVNAVWPGSSLHYMRAIQSPRWEDYEMRWNDGIPGLGAGNMWAWLGTGSTPDMAKGEDVSPYMAFKEIDPAWLKAMGFRGDIEKEREKDEANLKKTLEERKKTMAQQAQAIAQPGLEGSREQNP